MEKGPDCPHTGNVRFFPLRRHATLHKAFKATADTLGAHPRRRILWAVAFFVSGLAAAVLVGAGKSDAQDDYAPLDPITTYPSTGPTNTSPAPRPSPLRTPSTTSPATTPAPTPRPPRNTVVIKGTSVEDFRFSPRTLRVRRGRLVRWSWNGDAPHNVAFRRLRKRSRTASEGRFRLRFGRRGTHRYLCTVHGFRGKIVVR